MHVLIATYSDATRDEIFFHSCFSHPSLLKCRKLKYIHLHGQKTLYWRTGVRFQRRDFRNIFVSSAVAESACVIVFEILTMTEDKGFSIAYQVEVETAFKNDWRNSQIQKKKYILLLCKSLTNQQSLTSRDETIYCLFTPIDPFY